MTFKKLLGLSLLLMFAVSTITMTSCGKKQGCTTLESDNYDAEAEEDDGSCTPWSDKFLGDYDVQLSCQLLEALNNPFTMQVTRVSDNQMTMALTTGLSTSAIPVTANIDTKNHFDMVELPIPDQNIRVANPNAGGEGQPDSLTINHLLINGSGTIEGSVINGNISVTAHIVENNSDQTDGCGMVATKK